MSWIRVEAAGGLRIMAPSFNPPPRVEGIDKLYDSPICAHAFHCFRTRSMAVNSADGRKEAGSSSMSFVEEVLVLVQRKQLGGKLGDLTITVGSATATQDELEVLLQCSLETIMRTNNSGAQLILDALCASSLSCAHTAMDDVVEYDGLPMHFKTLHDSEKSNGRWRKTDDVPPSIRCCGALRRAAFERRKALLYFVGQDIVPVSLLYCSFSRENAGRLKSRIANFAPQDCKDLKSLATSATRACMCLTEVINRTLKSAFKATDATCRVLWNGSLDELPFVAAFSTSGLLCASPSFFRITDHRDRLFIAALGLDHLSRWSLSQQQHTSAQVPLLHTRELLLKCGKDGLMIKLAFISVGSAVSCVFGFRAAGEGVWWDAATLLRFVENHVVTPRVDMLLSGASADGNGGEIEFIGGAEAPKEFAPHLTICTVPIHPTPWLHQLLHEVKRIEDETPREVILGMGSASSAGIPPVSESTCECFPLFLGRGEKAIKDAAPFVWYKNVGDLPLDMAWCVASSRIVMAEANVCTNGMELGHHALFLMKCSISEDAADVWRYGVGWFQHCWRSPLRAGNEKDKNDRFDAYYYHYHNNTPQEDPTKLLQGLSSVGGGPRASTHYDLSGVEGGCFFQRKPKLEVRADGDASVFTCQTTVFPHSLLFEDGEVCDNSTSTLVEDTRETRWMTAFYVICCQNLKNTACGALLQKMLLLDGDQAEHEEDITTLLLQHQRKGHWSSPRGKAFASCHQAACCVLEEVANATRNS